MVLKRWRRDRDGGLPGGRGIPAPPSDPAGGRGSRRRRDEPARPELVELTVGFDRFEAGALVARLEASDIPVRLLTMDDHGLVVGMVARHPHRILIRADDEDRVRAIMERAGP
ncbi:MAG TPA: hypothetical protein DCS55_20650 [Acidimicrobiaceae bacterium]|nr:hypothetical protein [Acidimicrobiaceae bacterium]